ncbi:MAG: hypothetical protein JSV90_01615 [Methanobacteriota archaeon]|nr:MAG: hypothetical protein JSV90_01615 [Euryarchaeota archaeon]
MARPNEVRPDEVERKLKMEYLYGQKDIYRRSLDGVQSLMEQLREPQLDIKAMMQQVADLIARQFWIREVTVGSKDPVDGKLKYDVASGLREEARAALASIEYTERDFVNTGNYRGRSISKYTKLYLAEDMPYTDDEKGTFSRPILLQSRRRSLDECLEGDYFDIHILGERDRLLGWIETSGTRDGRFPDSVTMRWMELLAMILGAAMTKDNARRR